jgi:hypothetical protein
MNMKEDLDTGCDGGLDLLTATFNMKENHNGLRPWSNWCSQPDTESRKVNIFGLLLGVMLTLELIATTLVKVLMLVIPGFTDQILYWRNNKHGCNPS